jgi:hypothetical protein
LSVKAGAVVRVTVTVTVTKHTQTHVRAVRPAKLSGTVPVRRLDHRLKSLHTVTAHCVAEQSLGSSHDSTGVPQTHE